MKIHAIQAFLILTLGGSVWAARMEEKPFKATELEDPRFNGNPNEFTFWDEEPDGRAVHASIAATQLISDGKPIWVSYNDEPPRKIEDRNWIPDDPDGTDNWRFWLEDPQLELELDEINEILSNPTPQHDIPHWADQVEELTLEEALREDAYYVFKEETSSIWPERYDFPARSCQWKFDRGTYFFYRCKLLEISDEVANLLNNAEADYIIVNHNGRPHIQVF